MTREENAEWDWIRGRKAEFKAELSELQGDDADHEYRQIIENDIAHAKRISGKPFRIELI